MQIERLFLNSSNAPDVWGLISEVASLDLSFPAKALGYFGKMFDVSSGELNEKTQPPMFIAKEGLGINGVLVGAGVEGGVGTIIWLVVSPVCRGKGIGKALFERACDEYRSLGAHKVKLTVPTQEAVKFYENMGMEVEGYHPAHWWGLDFWSLGKLLNNKS